MPWIYVQNPRTLTWTCIPDPYYRCAPTTDPWWDYVVLQMHFEGVDQSSTFTDSSKSNRTFSVHTGTPVISTTASKFGSSSLYLNGSSSISTPTFRDYEFGTQDFTIEAWFRMTGPSPLDSGSRHACIASTLATTANGWLLAIQGDSTDTGTGVIFQTRNAGSTQDLSANYTFSYNTWHHVAVCRAGTTLKIFANGREIGSRSSTFTIQSSGSALRIGRNVPAASLQYFFTGYIDELRITRGFARYRGSFSVPTASFSDEQWGINSFNTVTTNVTIPASLTSSTTYGNGTISVYGFHNVSPYPLYRYYSLDNGLTWSGGSVGANGEIRAVLFRDGWWVGTSGNSFTSNLSVRSSDGINFTVLNNLPAFAFWYGIGYGNGTWILGTYNSSTTAYSTNNGLTWTMRATTATETEMLVYGNGVWLAGGRNNARVYRSTNDGVTWSAAINIPGCTGMTTGSGTFVNGYFFLSAGSGSTNIWRSTDGLTWTTIPLPVTVYGPPVWTGQFYFIWASPTAIMSEDGINWKTIQIPYSNGNSSGVTGLATVASTNRLVFPAFRTTTAPVVIMDLEEIPYQHLPHTVVSVHVDNAPAVDTSCEDPKLITIDGQATITNVPSMFGGGALYTINDNTPQTTGMTIDNTNQLHFDYNDFTIEMWAYRTSNDYVGTLFYYTPTTLSFTLTVNVDGTITGTLFAGGSTTTVTSNRIFSLNTWHHVVVQRRALYYDVFLDGTLLFFVAVPNGQYALVNPGGPLYIGRTNAPSASTWNGYIDEVHVTSKVGRYDGYPYSSVDPHASNVVLLINNGLLQDNSPNASTVTRVGTGYVTREFLGNTGSSYIRAQIGANGIMTGDFTVEIFAMGGGNNTLMMATGGLQIYDNSVQGYGGASIPAFTNWNSGTVNSVIISRVGSTIYVYSNGIQTGTATYAGIVDLSELQFGRFIPSNNLYWTGPYGGIRVTRNVGRYTTTADITSAWFTPPTMAYCDSTTSILG